MKSSVFDYAATDLWLLLYLTAEGSHTGSLDRLHTVRKAQFDPELVAGAEDHWMGIPDIITCSSVEINVNDDGELDGKSSSEIGMMKLSWVKPDPLTDRDLNHRDDGPAQIEFQKFITGHKQGQRTSFHLGSWKFLWYQHGRLKRDGGPFSINGGSLDFMIDANGAIRSTREIPGQFGWNHPGGGNLSDAAIRKAVTENDIDLFRLAPGASVFRDEMEQAIFYGSVQT